MPALRIVQNGKPRAAVILPRESSQILRDAAADLVRVIAKMSGARLPVVSDASRSKMSARILLGASEARKAGISLDAIGPEGYRLVRVGDDLVIAGPTDEATAHGVYGFLQDVLGVRWLMPGDLWEVVPNRRSIAVASLDAAVSPSFLFRVYSGLADARWLARNRLTYDASRLPCYGFGHNLKQIIKPSVYGKDHPEYFAEINGKRFVPGSDSDESSQPCFTNPDVIRITAEEARAFFDANPQHTTFSLCTNDNMDYCTCKKCAALDAPARTWRNEPVHSNSYWHYVSEVAKEVAKTHPGRYLGCYAYWGTDSIPRRIRRLPNNVSIAHTQDTSQHFDPAYRRIDRDILRRWAKVAAHVSKYDYYGLGWLTPRYFPSLTAGDLRFCHRLRLAGFYCEAYPYWAITGPMVWLGAQLMWNAKTDWRALMDEFMRAAFGPAAPHMKRFYAALERIWTRPRQGMWFQGLDKMRYETAIVDAAKMQQAWRLLEQASSIASGDFAKRVARIRSGFEMSYLLATIFADAKRLAEQRIVRKADLERILSGSVEVLSRLSEPTDSFEKHLRDDPAYAHVYFRPPRLPHKLETWRQEIGELVSLAMRRALIWAKGHLHPREIDAFQQDSSAHLQAIPSARDLAIM